MICIDPFCAFGRDELGRLGLGAHDGRAGDEDLGRMALIRDRDREGVSDPPRAGKRRKNGPNLPRFGRRRFM